MTKESAVTLVRVLIVKSIGETLLVGLVAVSFFADAFPPSFRGWGEATPRSIAGWVVNDAAPGERVEVQLFIDARFDDSTVADKSRPDVAAAGWAKDEWHGFEFFPNGLARGDHEARAYALHTTASGSKRTLQLIGDPIHFRVGEDGLFRDLNKRTQP